MVVMNEHYLGAKFELVGKYIPNPYVIFTVPISINAGEFSKITQRLGIIKKKNDRRYVAFRKPNRTFFRTYPKDDLYEKVFPTIEAAQQFIIDGIPDGIDRSHIRFLSDDEIARLVS